MSYNTGASLQLRIYSRTVTVGRTEAKPAARRALLGANTVSDKAQTSGTSKPARLHLAKRHPPYSPTRHASYTHHRFNNLSFQRQFVLEAHVSDGRNPTLAVLWFCSRVLIKHNSNCAVLALMKHWGRWTEKSSSYSEQGLVCSFKPHLSATDFVKIYTLCLIMPMYTKEWIYTVLYFWTHLPTWKTSAP